MQHNPGVPSGKLILITGVTRGLGRAMVDEFARLGHKVAGCGRSTRAIEKLRSTIGPPHEFYAVNVADDDAVKTWASVVMNSQGVPDLVLNNAGIINASARLWEISAREFSEVVDINLKGVANVIRHFAPEMVKRKHGVVVNFSSGWGRAAEAEVAPYCATKWAIEGLTQSLAQELPANMAALALNPGIINTDMLTSCFGGSAANYPSAEEWAKIAAPFLLQLGPGDNGKQMTVPFGGREHLKSFDPFGPKV